MKQLIFIIVIIAICISINADVLSKAKFGNWDRWDEELPSWNNEGWDLEHCRLTFVGFPYIRRTLIWLPVEEGKFFAVSGTESIDNTFFLLTHLSFIKDKKSQASIILFSPATAGKNVEGVKCNNSVLNSAKFAIVAFPPDKKEIVMRVYENENGLFRLLEEWGVAFQNKTIIIPEKTVKFSQKYEEFVSQSQQLNNQNITVSSSSIILIVRDDKKREFNLGVSLEILDGKKIITPIFY
jgi:hypothetical protein